MVAMRPRGTAWSLSCTTSCTASPSGNSLASGPGTERVTATPGDRLETVEDLTTLPIPPGTREPVELGTAKHTDTAMPAPRPWW